MTGGRNASGIALCRKSAEAELLQDEGAAATSEVEKSPRSYHMYVVECADGTLYTGYATDVEQRVRAHNEGRGAKYTRSRGPVRLAASASFATKHEALSAEFRFKRLSRAEKLACIEDAKGDSTAFAHILSERFLLS